MTTRLGIVQPSLTAIQTAFTGRLYSWDLFLLYRALSGQYTTYPSILAGGVGLSLQQDLVTFVGAFGPVGRFHYVGDVYSVAYNDMIERDIRPLGLLDEGFWRGWRRFTRLLQEDADDVGEPLRFPGRRFSLPKAELDVSRLSAEDRFIYAVYRGDVDSLEILLNLMTIYMPETQVVLPLSLRDLSGIFELYADWVRMRFTGASASRGARIMAKAILLSDYRWFALAGDLLGLAEQSFRDPAFTRGTLDFGTLIRQEAERIRVSGGETA